MTMIQPSIQQTTLVRRAELFDIPLPGEISPDAEAARLHTVEWLRRFGVCTGDEAISEYDALRLDRLSAFFYPQATGRELDLANDLNGWFFVFDDQFDGELGHQPEAVSQLVDRVVEITSETERVSQPAVDNPLLASFRDLWQRINSSMPSVWRDRFRANWVGYLVAHKREARDRTGHSLHSLDALLSVKRHSVGVQPCLDLHERFGNYALPDAVHGGFPLAEMRKTTDDVVIFINDIVSLDKELAAGDVHNSVILLREQNGSTLEEAVRCVADLANSRYRRFEELAEELPDHLGRADAASPLLQYARAYVQGMRYVMSGSLAWSLETSRYDERGVAAMSSGRQRPWGELSTSSQATAGTGCRTV